MGYEVKPDGTIIAPDEASALSLARKLRAELRAERGQHQAVATDGRSAEQIVTALLRAVGEAGKDGIESSVLSKKLAVKPKGLSPYLLRAKAKIEACAPRHVGPVLWRTQADGKTRWCANPELLKALGLV